MASSNSPELQASSNGDGGSGNSGNSTSRTTKSQQSHLALWEMDASELNNWAATVPALNGTDNNRKEATLSLDVANQIWANLTSALQDLKATEQTPTIGENGDEQAMNLNREEAQNPSAEGEPSNKRMKLEHLRKKAGRSNRNNNKKKTTLDLLDPMDLYRHTIRLNERDDDDDKDFDPIHEAASELKSTMGGKLTQLTVSGVLNGMAGARNGLVKNKQFDIRDTSIKNDTPVPTAGNTTFQQLKQLATALHQAIKARVEADILVTTPIRIQEMLAADLLPNEFKAIRKRIYDTVILGKGLAQPEELDIPTAASTGVHDIEKFKKCKACGNNDQSLFVLDRKNGDVICSNCGTVASESLMHEGSQFRKFEGEVDRNHHGDTANPLYSNAHNMSTTLGGVQITTGAGLGGFGSQKKGLEVVLRNAHAYTELNISQFGKGDRRTRIGYKDKQKKDAFMQMTHCGDALNLHEAVVQRAKELFAGFRDDRELVQQFKGVIAACLCEAFDQLSSNGKQILKQKQEIPQESFNNPRASRRNELHHANLAGKGGILLDFSAVKREKEEVLSSVAQKPASTWDLDDCRSWLMEASRSIAQQWIQDRKTGTPKIPDGTQEELEGKLVEHAITLNDALEAELRKQVTQSTGMGRGRVITPRVKNMAKLGIKWQHSHERGSGGKGGVGGSGAHSTQNISGRTAGQVLILKTAKKLGLMLKDDFAGRSIHKELRALISKQEAKKRKLQREEATRQRFAQMRRKPWLQARAQAEN